MDQRQGGLAFGQVVTEVLAQRGSVGGVVEHVVSDLEGIAEVQPVGVQRLTVPGLLPAQHRAQPGGGGKQHRGLALDYAQIGRLIHVGVVDVQKLQHLALGDRVGGVGQHLHHRHAVQLHHELEAARVEEVADQHAGRVAPQRIGGLAPAPQVGFVDHVVVQQGGGVDELDDRRQLQVVAPRIAQRARGDEVQLRAQALAAGADDVFADLIDEQHVRGQAAADQGVDAGQILTHQALDVVGRQRTRRGEVGSSGCTGHRRIIRADRPAFRCTVGAKSQAPSSAFPVPTVATIY